MMMNNNSTNKNSLPQRRERSEEDEDAGYDDDNKNNQEEEEDTGVIANTAEIDTDDEDADEFVSDAQKKKRVAFRTDQEDNKHDDNNEDGEDEEDEEDKKNFFRKNNNNEDLGNEEDDENNEMIKSMQAKEALASSASNKTQKNNDNKNGWNQTQVEAAKSIIENLKFPDESPSTALKNRLLSTATNEKTKAQNNALMEAISNFEMATALTSSYSQQTVQTDEKPISQMKRDEILTNLLSAPSPNNNNKIEPFYLLSWSENAPESMNVKSIFGPCKVVELNNWCKKGFFEKKQAFVLNINERDQTKRKWLKVPKKTGESIEV